MRQSSILMLLFDRFRFSQKTSLLQDRCRHIQGALSICISFSFNNLMLSDTPGPWFVRFLGQEILRTNQKRTNQVTDDLGGIYVHIRINEDRAHQ